MSRHKRAASQGGKTRQRFWPGDRVMTPGGPGVVKFVFAAGGSLKRPASYTVTLAHRRPGVVFLEPELQQLTVDLSIDVERGAVGRTQD